MVSQLCVYGILDVRCLAGVVAPGCASKAEL